MKRVGLLLAGIASLVLLGLAVGVCFRWADGVPAPAAGVRPKSYARLLAEGVRYRDTQHLGFDRFAFKSCRVEKRRKGAITFGAFNVLVVDGLVVNGPVVPEETERDGGKGAEVFAEAFLRSQGFSAGRFSGLRINGLTVNRCVSNRVECIFSAGLAESGMGQDGLRLHDCVVRAPDGSAARADHARLVLKPDPALVYTRDGVERRVGL